MRYCILTILFECHTRTWTLIARINTSSDKSAQNNFRSCHAFWGHSGRISHCNPGTARAEAEDRKSGKYRDLIDDGSIFQPIAFEVMGAAGSSSEIFLNMFCIQF